VVEWAASDGAREVALWVADGNTAVGEEEWVLPIPALDEGRAS
jgi:hypothetical protein